jgi:hypothetical protein
MPKTLAQWTGIFVTATAVLGCDKDVLFAVPLGLMAGMMATLFMDLAEAFEKAQQSRARPVRISRGNLRDVPSWHSCSRDCASVR